MKYNCSTKAGPTYDEYFRILKQVGYNQRISVECSNAFVEEAAEGLTYLKAAWDAAANDDAKI